MAKRKSHPLRDRDADADTGDELPKKRAPTGRAKGFAHLQAGRSAKSIPQVPAPQDLGPRTSDLGREPSEPKERRRPLDGEGRPYITLAQLLKMAKIVESGGEAKHRVREGGIIVNGQAEDRPGRKLHAGDVVKIDGDEITVDLG